VHRRSLPLLLTLVSIGCGGAERQDSLTLEAKLPATFGQLSNVVELGSGRVMFADTREKLFFSADLASGKIDTLGTRADSLPPESPASVYRFPGWVAHLRGDTVALVDFGAIRTTLWSEDGRALEVLPIAPVAGATPVLLYDTVGHGYKIDYQAVLGGGEPGQVVRPDSIPVLRIVLRSGATDTIAFLAAPEYGEATFGTQTQTVAKVFGPNDFFGVLADGTAWVARGRENRVDWRSPSGAWTRGKARRYTPVAVTQDDRDRVVAQVREQGRQHGLPDGLAISYPFAEQKPPFDYALGRGDGEVWLQRSRARQDEAMHYDVFDRGGAWKREVVFPAGASLAGFGRDGAVYVSVKDGDRRTVGRLRSR
jgi:hypothetical protein